MIIARQSDVVPARGRRPVFRREGVFRNIIPVSRQGVSDCRRCWPGRRLSRSRRGPPGHRAIHNAMLAGARMFRCE